MGVLILVLFAAPKPSFADWSAAVSFGGPGYHHDDRHFYHHDEHRFYRWHDHPHFGIHFHYLPEGCFSVWVGWHRYFYYDGLYYSYIGGDYVLVNPPMGAYVGTIPSDFRPVIINGVTYYTSNGTYYILTRYHGYRVVAAPVVYAQPVPVAEYTQNIIPVNVPNNYGGYKTEIIKRSGNGFVGPQGEFYVEFPRISQLKIMYGR